MKPLVNVLCCIKKSGASVRTEFICLKLELLNKVCYVSYVAASMQNFYSIFTTKLFFSIKLELLCSIFLATAFMEFDLQ